MTLAGITTYHRPTSVEAAWELVRDGMEEIRLLSGGTDLVVSCPPQVRQLVDLADTGLRYVTVDETGVRIGATTTFTDLLEHAATATYAGGVVRDVLAQVGSVLHRNSATIGGHLARARLSDVIPALLALDAEVTTFDGATRTDPVDAHLAVARRRGIVTEVRLPASARDAVAGFHRFARAAFDHALVNACCRADVRDGEVERARVVVGGSSQVGRRVPAAEAALVGHPLAPDTVAAAAAAARDTDAARSDWSASADYRRQLAGLAVARCLEAMAGRSGGAG